MPKVKSDFQKATGKLISSIQKEWGEELGLGESRAEFTENIMNNAHNLLQAGSLEEVKKLLGNLNVLQYLGEVWVQKHPQVKTAISAIENLLNNPSPRSLDLRSVIEGNTSNSATSSP
jgi:hypothetical protein